MEKAYLQTVLGTWVNVHNTILGKVKTTCKTTYTVRIQTQNTHAQNKRNRRLTKS